MQDLSIKHSDENSTLPIKTRKVINVASVPHRSLFRYPGGKTWLVPTVRDWFDQLDYRPTVFIDPFTGGGIVPLSALFEDRVDKIVLAELDHEVAAVWHTVIDDPSWLISQIEQFDVTLENVRTILDANPETIEEIAFRTIVKNRTQRGGILAKGASLMKSGENGKGLASRWYPQTLVKRIQAIFELRDRILVHEGDGLEIVADHSADQTAAYFIDPPYTAGGKRAGSRLYNHSQLDHIALFDVMATVTGKFLMTYDNATEVIKMAQERNFMMERIPMKNTHHRKMFELLLSN